MLEMLICALIVAEIIIIGIALYNTFKVSEFHKNEKAYNKYLKELLEIEKETNKELVKDQAYLTNEVIKLLSRGSKMGIEIFGLVMLIAVILLSVVSAEVYSIQDEELQEERNKNKRLSKTIKQIREEIKKWKT